MQIREMRQYTIAGLDGEVSARATGLVRVRHRLCGTDSPPFPADVSMHVLAYWMKSHECPMVRVTPPQASDIDDLET